MSASRYERITAGGETRDVAIDKEGPAVVLAWVVNSEGSRTDTQWLISKSEITKRIPLQINLTYGELERT